MAEIEDLKIVGGSTYTVGNQDIVANEWEAGKTYVKNKSYVIREHRLYVCNVTHTSVEPFDATKWTEITIGDAIAANTTAIGDLSSLDTIHKSSAVDAINEVNGGLPLASLVSFDASKWNSKTSNREIRITKYGKVVSLYIVFTLTSALSANESIISNGGVPPIGLNQNEYQFPITCVSGTNAGKSARVRISKEGGISDWYSQNTFFASSCTFLMNATYITN